MTIANADFQCVPPPWAKNGHTQTLFGHFIKSPRDSRVPDEVRIGLDDGDILSAQHFPGDGTLVCAFHGLGGHSETDYMHRTALLCEKRGWGCLLVNHRGCGTGRGLARHPYHSGIYRDLSRVFEFARSEWKYSFLAGVGYSLSGNALALLMSEDRCAQPDFALSVNAPIELGLSSFKIGTGFNRVYDTRFVLRCRSAIRERLRDGLISENYEIPFHSRIRDLDCIYTSVAGGFRSREHYYSSCSSYYVLRKITRPVVLLTAEDDPFIDVRFYKNIEVSPTTHVHIEKVGGHMGYLSQRVTPLGTKRWLDYAVAHYLDEMSRKVASMASLETGSRDAS